MSSRLRSSTRASTVASESLAETETKIKGESTRRTTTNKALRGNELVRLKRIATGAFLLAITIVVGTIYFSIHDVIRLYPSSIRAETLKGFSARAEYALRYQTLLFAWLIFNIYAVIYVRLSRGALNPLVDSTEKQVQQIKNILTNSMEQVFLSSMLQLAFASFAEPALFKNLIPAVNVVQLVGRVAFFFGYPYYRTLGYVLTSLPNTLLLGFNLFKFGSYLGFY